MRTLEHYAESCCFLLLALLNNELIFKKQGSVKTAYLCQVRNGAHAHLEQPAFALSWKTRALRDLPGFHAVFDQCQYGAQCLDYDGLWKPVKKTTGIQTTKHYLYKELNLRCPGDHQHCLLEGSAPGLGRRTQFMEDYQPGYHQ